MQQAVFIYSWVCKAQKLKCKVRAFWLLHAAICKNALPAHPTQAYVNRSQNDAKATSSTRALSSYPDVCSLFESFVHLSPFTAYKTRRMRFSSTESISSGLLFLVLTFTFVQIKMKFYGGLPQVNEWHKLYCCIKLWERSKSSYTKSTS